VLEVKILLFRINDVESYITKIKRGIEMSS
jgi:hypothetical protein